MRNKQRKWIVLFAILALISFLIPVLTPLLTARADTVTDLELKLEEAKKAQEEAEANIAAVQGEITDAKSQRESLDKDISALETELYQISLEIETNEANIATLGEELASAEEEADNYNTVFQNRVRIMYERGSLSTLTILFSAKDFTDLLKRAELISQIAAYDASVLERMENTKEEIRTKKTALEDANTIVALNRDIQAAKKAELDASRSALETTISALQADEEAYLATLDEADAAEAALREEIRKLTTPATPTAPPPATQESPEPEVSAPTPSVDSGGQFCWPTPSTTYITSPYGTRYHPVQKRNKTHTGIDIGAGHGADILAAEGGTVLRAGWNSGYGNYIVIDHGSGIQTLYGHCSALLVETGQAVSRGQKIALVGSTGVSTGPHLHFEVLINGSYTDPMSYFQ